MVLLFLFLSHSIVLFIMMLACYFLSTPDHPKQCQQTILWNLGGKIKNWHSVKINKNKYSDDDDDGGGVGKEEERAMFQQMQAMAQKQVNI